jgi:hypothetical protein
MQVLSVLLEVEDGITDKLARPVKRHVAAALYFEQLDTARREKCRTGDEILLLRRATECYDWRVFHQQQHIVSNRAADPLPCNFTLKLQTLLVTHRAEPNDPQFALDGHGISDVKNSAQ